MVSKESCSRSISSLVLMVGSSTERFPEAISSAESANWLIGLVIRRMAERHITATIRSPIAMRATKKPMMMETGITISLSGITEQRYHPQCSISAGKISILSPFPFLYAMVSEVPPNNILAFSSAFWQPSSFRKSTIVLLSSMFLSGCATKVPLRVIMKFKVLLEMESSENRTFARNVLSICIMKSDSQSSAMSAV